MYKNRGADFLESRSDKIDDIIWYLRPYLEWMIWSQRSRPLSPPSKPSFAMAPEAPDPKSLKSWHDAFQYPIPTVRRVEQELRRDIASNREKLRALVG